MDPFLLFLFGVVLISLSGALAPGPLLFTNLSNATRWGWKGGIWLSLGHTCVELPVILLIAFGLSYVIYIPLVQFFIAILGGSVLLIFGALQIREALLPVNHLEQTNLAKSKPGRHPFFIGLIFSALNPFFIVWWFTVGVNIVLTALLFAALAGVLIMFFSHVWIDYVWLAGTAFATQRGAHLIGSKGYRILIALFGLLLVYFSLLFYYSALLLVGLL
ncbi:MAG: LysE family transporter [Promethearchaeota archaeon]